MSTLPEMQATLTFDSLDTVWGVTLPGQGYIGGILNPVGEMGTFSISRFLVNEGLRGQGIGARLMLGALALAKEHGATTISTHMDSPIALHILYKTVGGKAVADRLTFKDAYAGAPDLPLTPEQAISSLQREQELSAAEEPPLDDTGLIVTADISALDTTGWEMPHQLNQPGNL